MEHYKIKEILDLRDSGLSYGEIARIVGVSKSTVAFYSNEEKNRDKISEQIKRDGERKTYESIVCATIAECRNWNHVCIMLNKRATMSVINSLKEIADRNTCDYSHLSFENRNSYNKTRRYSADDIFVSDSQYKGHLLNAILRFGLMEEQCAGCGKMTTEYRGNVVKIPLQVHHVNGVHNDNRLENLELLCPTCHALTDNFAGKNAKHYKRKVKNNKPTPDKHTNCPDKDTLISDYKRLGSFLGISKKYGVSDVAVKKWFKKLGLPYKVKEIRAYIIELYGHQPQWYEYRANTDYSRSVEKTGKKVNIYDANGEFLTIARSLAEASSITGIDKRTVKRCCDGKSIKNKEYRFTYNV